MDTSNEAYMNYLFGLLACYAVWVCGRLWVRTPPGAVVRKVFHRARILVRFPLLKCPSTPNYKFGSPQWGSVSCIMIRPSASPSYEASSHVYNYAYSGKSSCYY